MGLGSLLESLSPQRSQPTKLGENRPNPEKTGKNPGYTTQHPGPESAAQSGRIAQATKYLGEPRSTIMYGLPLRVMSAPACVEAYTAP